MKLMRPQKVRRIKEIAIHMSEKDLGGRDVDE